MGSSRPGGKKNESPRGRRRQRRPHSNEKKVDPGATSLSRTQVDSDQPRRLARSGRPPPGRRKTEASPRPVGLSRTGGNKKTSRPAAAVAHLKSRLTGDSACHVLLPQLPRRFDVAFVDKNRAKAGP